MTSSYHLEDRGKCNKNTCANARNVPKLRFKGYNYNYDKIPLKNISTRIKRVNSDSTAPIMMISANCGFIMQSEKYSRDNAGKSLTKYTIIHKGELAYNHGASKAKPYGCCFQIDVDEARIPYVYHCFKIDKNNYAPYIALYLNNKLLERELRKLVSSSVRMDGLLNISYEDYTNIKLNLPRYEEQKKIASFLTLIDKKIEKQKELVELLKKYKRGLLSSIFNQKLRFKEFDSYWGYKTLKSITTLIKDGTHGSYKDVNNGIPLLSAKDIESGKVVIPADCRKISIEDYENIYKNYSLNKDDILITIVGTIGRLALVGELKQKFALQRSVGILRVNENNNARFISYVLQSEHVKRQFYSKVNQSAQGGIYLDTLGKIDFYSPSLREQEKIANIMLEMDNIIEKETNLLNLYNDYEKGLLQKMFI